MAGLPEFSWSYLSKNQLLSRRTQYAQALNGYRRTPPMKPGADRDRVTAKLAAVEAELALPRRQAEWPEG